VDDHLFKDLPALVEMIVRETGVQQLHWIGAPGLPWCSLAAAVRPGGTPTPPGALVPPMCPFSPSSTKPLELRSLPLHVVISYASA
jgi:hypothetical protein